MDTQTSFNPSATPSLLNGVVKIGRKGRKSYQFGDTPPFEVDVIRTHDHLVLIDRQFRPDADKPIPTENLLNYMQTVMEYVAQVSGVADLTEAEVMEFQAQIAEDSNALRPFFDPSLRRGSSSPGSSASHSSA